MNALLRASLTLLLVSGCGPAEGSDAGDASRMDASPLGDAGFDAGRRDARPDDDAALDAGTGDGGAADSGADAGCVSAACGADLCGAQADGCGGLVDCGSCSAGRICSGGTCVTGVVVTNDAELMAAIAAGTAATIVVAPGLYTVSDMVAGRDRTAVPLTIQALDPGDKPVFEDATQSLRLTRHVTFRNLDFDNTGALDSSDIWFGDAGGNGENGDTSHITIEGCDFTSPSPGGESSPTVDPTYADGMPRLFRFSNYATHTYTIRDITATYVYQVGDFRMNGEVLIDNVEVDFWYFDGIRIVGSPDEGYVDGNRIISNVDLTNNIAIYEEIDGTGAPHPDHTQVFNTGSTVNNTNPRVENLMFYRNRFNAGQYRSTNTQTGLTESRMVNVAYIENVWATKASPHGVSLAGGANGVLIERNTMADVDWASRPWVRIFRTDGQVLVADSIFPGDFNLGTGGNANLAGYELDTFSNTTGSTYDALFVGPGRENGIAALMTMFTPRAGVGGGALSAAGTWRGGAHRALRAEAPTVSGGTGSFTVDVIAEPTLESPDQAVAGGDAYSRYDLRWSIAGSHSWTTVSDVSPADLVGSVASGTVHVQTRCVNAAGEGLWSRTSQVLID